MRSKTPVSKKTSKPQPRSFNESNCFNIEVAPSDPDDDEEQDDYWSDEEM